MFTKNWNLWLYSRLAKRTCNYSGTNGLKYVPDATYYAIDGSVISVIRIAGNSSSSATYSDDAYWRSDQNNIRFGTSSATPTADDYTIQDAGLTVSGNSKSIGIDTATGHLVATITLSVTNNTASSVTVNEVGITQRIKKSTGNSSVSVRHLLLWRDVLAQPIVLAAGAGTTVTVRVDFSA